MICIKNPILLLIFILLGSVGYSQNDALAKDYYDRGQFDKAALAYEELYKTASTNPNYYLYLIKSYQELKAFDKAEKIITEVQKKINQPNLLIELGYNYQLQNQSKKAEEAYKKALEVIDKTPQYGSSIAYSFEQKNLLELALQSYEISESKNPAYNFEMQKARIYGQQGNLDKMIEANLNYVYQNPNFTPSIQNQFSRFINEDGSDDFNQLLRKALLTRAQKTQDIYWNEFLSWYFIQNKQYDRAFAQEKAIYLRNQESFSNIINLAILASDEEDTLLAKEIYKFILEQTQDIDTRIIVENNLLELQIQSASTKEYKAIESKFESLYQQYGNDLQTVALQLTQANFLGFKAHKIKEAQDILKRVLSWNLNPVLEGEIKLELGDLFVLEEKFNQGLLYYAQVEANLKNHQLAHQANLKTAKTSYFKGDFEWSLKQLSVLKTSYSQLIANDALDLFLIITDNSQNDSTYTALKKFARADFLIYQNKPEQALKTLETILSEHKQEPIEPLVLLRMGELYQTKQDFNQALNYFQQIIQQFPESIYLDEAIYYTAQLYHKKLNDSTKAMEYYQRILFHHQDSIYYTDARQHYRLLRGDTL